MQKADNRWKKTHSVAEAQKGKYSKKCNGFEWFWQDSEGAS